MPALLNYAFLSDPDPLQAGAPTPATLTLIVSNPGSQLVTVRDLVVTLPVGTTAKTLTPNATGIQTQPPAGWNVSPSGGELTLTPATPQAAQVGAAGLAFVFARIAVNAEPGTAAIPIDETASSPSQPQQTRTAMLAVDKFPRQFAVSGLTATPLRVDPGGSATLMWTGSPADYSLYYDPGTGPVTVPVGSVGPYVAANLVRQAGVAFTLQVSVRVPGQDLPLLLQRQAHVDVAAVTIDSFEASPSTVGAYGLTRLSWRTSNAASVTLDPGNLPVAASGVRFVAVAPGEGLFTLTARGSQPKWSAQQQRTVRIDPAIVATSTAYVKTGANGPDGPNGPKAWPNGVNGTRGEPGGGVSVTGRIPPLDPSSRPAQVIAVNLLGGNGGRGGNGGDASGGEEAQGHGGTGADGGPGGNAVFDGTFDDTLAPAQYLVQRVAAGSGGGGGRGGVGMGGYRAPDGTRGADGTASIAFHEAAAVHAEAVVGEAAPPWTLHCAPDPLAAGAPGATLTLVGAGTPGTVSVTLPIGPGAADLTDHPAEITATAPPGWRVEGRDGAFTFTAETGAGPAVFVFSGIHVNGQPGVCQIHVDALALPLIKLPLGSSVTPLLATPLRVASGGAATLMWCGAPAEYELRWDPGTGPVSRPVANAGAFVAGDLTALPGVVFTLAVTLPGGAVVERRAFVEVMP